jgi:DNA-binding winged helix-turn-helix (wHTH) protein
MAYFFAGYLFDPDTGLTYGLQRVALQPKERALLALLLQAGGAVVSKDVVAKQVWQDAAVSDESISRVVYRVRLAMQAVGGPPVVGTVYNSGFRLAAAVQWQPALRDGLVAPPRSDWYLVAGREWLARPAPAAAHLAHQALEAAVARTPESAPAWAALAELAFWQIVRGQKSPLSVVVRALDASERCLARDARCAPGRALRGWFRAMVMGDWDAGLADLHAAWACDCHHWLVCHLRADVLQATQAHESALEMAFAAHGLNPYNADSAAGVARQLLYAGQADAAWNAAHGATERFPAEPTVWETAALILSANGLWADAVVATDRALACASKMVPVNISQQFQRAFAVLQHDGSEENFANARSLAAIDCPPDCLARVWVLLALNQPLPAHAWLQDARQVRCPDFFTVRDDPRLRPWREWLPDLWLR